MEEVEAGTKTEAKEEHCLLPSLLLNAIQNPLPRDLQDQSLIIIEKKCTTESPQTKVLEPFSPVRALLPRRLKLVRSWHKTNHHLHHTRAFYQEAYKSESQTPGISASDPGQVLLKLGLMFRWASKKHGSDDATLQTWAWPKSSWSRLFSAVSGWPEKKTNK